MAEFEARWGWRPPLTSVWWLGIVMSVRSGRAGHAPAVRASCAHRMKPSLPTRAGDRNRVGVLYPRPAHRHGRRARHRAPRPCCHIAHPRARRVALTAERARAGRRRQGARGAAARGLQGPGRKRAARLAAVRPTLVPASRRRRAAGPAAADVGQARHVAIESCCHSIEI